MYSRPCELISMFRGLISPTEHSILHQGKTIYTFASVLQFLHKPHAGDRIYFSVYFIFHFMYSRNEFLME
jgi:hypothetical protein